MTAVESALAEIRSLRDTFNPQLEGLYDYRRLNILDSTRAAVEAAIVDYERRIAHLNGTEATLVALMDDGHPDLSIREVSDEVLADLKANRETIEAALKRFSSNAAASFDLTSGSPQPKI